jgi:phosphomannomutase
VVDPDQLIATATRWIANDPDETSRLELAKLLESANTEPAALAELSDCFAGSLQFGTAGLRGKLGPGPNRMNRAVVITAAYGLIEYLFDLLHNDKCPRAPRVVIGNDARDGSRQFAIDTAGVVVAAGGEALLLPDPVPTPVLAFAVRCQDADAGVMVTASHNPAADNGYKVYLCGRCVAEPLRGTQLVEPHDEEVAERIAAAPPAAKIKRADIGWKELGPESVNDYTTTISETGRLLEAACPGPLKPPKVVHTAMHGVGGQVALAALKLAGITDVTSVPEQAEPDPRFPTLPFPNPEEPGALKLGIQWAEGVGADVLLANDPDADRLAVAVVDPYTDDWRALSGDELGVVIGEILGVGLEGSPDTKLTFASSLVSSRLLGKIAAHHGLKHQTTLTGFKWLARVPHLAFAYEEAIGYCLRPDLVRDKDGLSAAVLVATLAGKLKAADRTMLDVLDDLARRHGLHLSGQLSLHIDDPAEIAARVAAIVASPPRSLADAAVIQVADLSQGYAGLPPTEGVLLLTERDDQVVVRPSGTEPKVKCYLEVIESVDPDATGDQLGKARKAAAKRLEWIKEQLAGIL